MNKLVTILFVCFFSLFWSVMSTAQQQAQFSQDMVNPYMINPALSGVEDFIDIKAGVRQQWVGVDGAPVTRYLTAHSSVGKTHHPRTKRNDYHNWHGVGGMFLNDQAGGLGMNTIVANYAYNLKISDGKGYGMHHKDGVRLAIGTFLGMTQFNFLDQPTVQIEGDNALQSLRSKKPWVTEASLGGMLYYLDKFYVGFSGMNLLGNSFNRNNDNISDISRFVRHYYFISAYKQKIGEDGLFLMPSVVARFASPLPVSIDINLRLDYKDTFFGGISYRNQDAIALLAGVIYNDTFEFGYSYDVTLSDLGEYSKGSHEIIVGLRLHHKILER